MLKNLKINPLNIVELPVRPVEIKDVSVKYSVKSSDGIIISSDSQGTNDVMKSYEVSKSATIRY
jgi:hypothetical protein